LSVLWRNMDIFFCLTFLKFFLCAIFQSISRTKWTGLGYIFVFVNIFLYIVNYAKSVFVYIVYMYETTPHNLLFPSLYLRSYGIAGNIVLKYAMVYQVLVRYLSKAGKVSALCRTLIARPCLYYRYWVESQVSALCRTLIARPCLYYRYFRISVWVESQVSLPCCFCHNSMQLLLLRA